MGVDIDNDSSGNVINISKKLSADETVIVEGNGSNTVNILPGADISGSIIMAGGNDTLVWSGGTASPTVFTFLVAMGKGDDTVKVTGSVFDASGRPVIGGGTGTDTIEFVATGAAAGQFVFTGGSFTNTHFQDFEKLIKSGSDDLVLQSDGNDSFQTITVSEGNLSLLDNWTITGVSGQPGATSVSVEAGGTLTVFAGVAPVTVNQTGTLEVAGTLHITNLATYNLTGSPEINGGTLQIDAGGTLKIFASELPGSAANETVILKGTLLSSLTVIGGVPSAIIVDLKGGDDSLTIASTSLGGASDLLFDGGGGTNDTVHFIADDGTPVDTIYSYNNGAFVNDYFQNFENLIKSGADGLLLGSDAVGHSLTSITVEAGTLFLTGKWALGSEGGAFVSSGATLSIGTFLVEGDVITYGTTSISGTLTVQDDSRYRAQDPTAIDGGTLEVLSGGSYETSDPITGGSGSDSIVVAGTLSATTISLGGGNDTLTLDTGGTLTATSVDGGGGTDTLSLTGTGTKTLNLSTLTGFETLSKSGGGTWTVNATTATFTSLSVNGGTLGILGDWTVNGSASVADGATLELGDGTNLGSVTVFGDLTLDGILKATSSGGMGVVGTATLNGGTLDIAAGGGFGAADIVGSAGVETIVALGNLSADSINLGAGADAITVGAGIGLPYNFDLLDGGGGGDSLRLVGTGSQTLNVDVLQNFATVTKEDGGTRTVRTTTASVGSLAVDGGTLKLTGTWTVSGTVTVASGATLEIAEGTTVAFVDVTGNATVDGTLKITTFGSMTVDGTTTLNGATLDIASGGGFYTTDIQGSAGVETIKIMGELGADNIDLGAGADMVTLERSTNLPVNLDLLDGGGGGDSLRLLGTGTNLLNVTTLRNFATLTKEDGGTSTIDATTASVGSLAVDGGTLELLGTDWTVTGSATVASGATLEVGDDPERARVTVGGDLNLNGTLKVGFGSMTVTGTTTLNGGTLDIAAGSDFTATQIMGSAGVETITVLGTIGASSIDLAGGADTITLDRSSNFPVVVDMLDGGGGGDSLRLLGTGTGITGTAALNVTTLQNFATLTKDEVGAWTIAAGTASVGSLSVDGGTLNLSGTWTAMDISVKNGASLTAAGPVTLSGGTLTVAAGGSFTLTGTLQGSGQGETLAIDGTFVHTGTIDLAGGADNVTLDAGNVGFLATTTLDGGDGTDALTLTGGAGTNGTLDMSTVVNFETIAKNDAGDWTLTATAQTTVQSIALTDGTLTLVGAWSITGNTLDVTAGTTMTIGDGSTATSVNEAGGTNIDGTLVISDMATFTAQGLTTVSSTGTLQIDAGGTYNANGGFVGTGDFNLIVNGTLNVAGTIDLGAGDNTLTLATGSTLTGIVDADGGTDTILLTGAGTGGLNLGQVQNFEAITKQDAGTWTLNASSAFATEDLTVSAGTLVLVGDVQLTSATPFESHLTVASGAVLQIGDGSTETDVLLNDISQDIDINGTLVVTDQAVITVRDNLVVAGGTLQIDAGGELRSLTALVGQNGTDTIVVAGTLTAQIVSLGRGDDRIKLVSDSFGALNVSGTVDGGDDTDTIHLTGGGSARVDDLRFWRGFEILLKDGDGTWTVKDGPTTGVASVTVDAGKLVLLGTWSVTGNTTTVAAGATLDIGDGETTTTLTEAGNVELTGTLNVVNKGTVTVAGATNLHGGTLNVGVVGGYTANGGVTGDGGNDTINVLGGTFNATSVDLGDGDNAILVDVGTLTVVIDENSQAVSLHIGTFATGTLTTGAGSDTITVHSFFEATDVALGGGDDSLILDSKGYFGFVADSVDGGGGTGDKIVVTGTASGTTVVFLQNVTGFETFEKTGSATWFVITNSASFENFDVKAGALMVEGYWNSDSASVAAGATLTIGEDDPTEFEVGGTTTVSGTLKAAGLSTVTLGQLALDGGRVEVQDTGFLSTTGISITNAATVDIKTGGSLVLTGGIVSTDATDIEVLVDGSFEKTGSGDMQLAGSGTVALRITGSFAAAGGSLTLDGTSTLLELKPTSDTTDLILPATVSALGEDDTLLVGGTADRTLTGLDGFTGFEHLIKEDANSWTLNAGGSGASVGAVTVNAGTLTLTGIWNIIGNTLTVLAGGTQNIGDGATATAVTESGDADISGILTVKGLGTLNVAGMTTVNAGGQLVVEDLGTFAGSDLTIAAGAEVDILTGGAGSSAVTSLAGSLTVRSGATYLTTGALTANGNALLQVAGGAFTASGTTTVADMATMTVDTGGSFDATGAVLVTDSAGLTVTNGGGFTAQDTTTVAASGTIMVSANGSFDAMGPVLFSDSGGLQLASGGSFTAKDTTTLTGTGGIRVDTASLYQAMGPVLIKDSTSIYVTGGSTFTATQGTTVSNEASLAVDNGGQYLATGPVLVEDTAFLYVGGATFSASGGTTVSGGANIGVDAGGLYQAAGPVLIRDGAAILVASGGVVTATGATTLEGNGLLRLSTGATYGSGQMVTLDGGSLQGLGRVVGQVHNTGGTVAARDLVGTETVYGTLTIEGSYRQGAGGRLVTHIQPAGPTTLLDVVGNAELSGTLTIDSVQAGFTAGQRFRVIATDAPITGMFTATNVTGAGLNGLVAWVGRTDDAGNQTADGNNVDILLIAPPTTTLDGLNRNQTAVAKHIGGLLLADTVLLETDISLFYASAMGGYAYDQLSSESYDAFTAFSFDTARQFGGLIDDRARSLRCGETGGAFCGAGRGGGATVSAAQIGAQLAALGTGPDAPGPGARKGFAPTRTAGWSVWASGLGSNITKDRTSENIGYSGWTTGGAIGVDLALSRRWVVGVLAGGARSNIDFSGVTTDGDMESVTVGVYTAWYGRRWFADAAFTYSKTWVDADRDLSLFGSPVTATGKTTGDQYAAHATLGYGLTFGKLAVEAAGGIDWVQLRQKSFTETGAGALNLTVNSRTDDSLRLRFGLRVARAWQVKHNLAVVPSLRVGYAREMLDTTRPIRASLASIGGSFTVTGDEGGRDFLTFGGGIQAVFTQGVTLFFRHSGEWSRDRLSNSFTGGLKISW